MSTVPKKKAKTIEQKQAEVLDSYESWLKKRAVKKARSVSGDVAEDEAKD